jgi:hypothetical protein
VAEFTEKIKNLFKFLSIFLPLKNKELDPFKENKIWLQYCCKIRHKKLTQMRHFFWWKTFETW